MKGSIEGVVARQREGVGAGSQDLNRALRAVRISERNSESASQVKVVSHVGVRTRALRSLWRIEIARTTPPAAAGFFLADRNHVVDEETKQWATHAHFSYGPLVQGGTIRNRARARSSV